MEEYDDAEYLDEEFDPEDNYIDKVSIRYCSSGKRVTPNVEKNKKRCDDEKSVVARFADINSNKSSVFDTNVNFPEQRNSFTERRRSRMFSIDENRMKKTVFEPTYRMEPKPDQYFSWYMVKNVLMKLITPLFDNFVYDSKSGPSMCKLVCNKAITTIKKKYEWPRYRYVCHVTLVQLNHQGLIIADRSLWMPEYDNNAVCLFKNKEAVMIVTFHGIYQE